MTPEHLSERRGIDPFDGIDDDKGSKWHLFKDQLATATESGGKREKLLVYGNQAPVTNENVDVEAGVMFAANKFQPWFAGMIQ